MQEDDGRGLGRSRLAVEDLVAVDGGGEAGLRQARRQPFQRAHMRLGKGRPVHAGLVGADRAQRVEIGQHAGAVGAG